MIYLLYETEISKQSMLPFRQAYISGEPKVSLIQLHPRFLEIVFCSIQIEKRYQSVGWVFFKAVWKHFLKSEEIKQQASRSLS